jgi:hypothetical protein
MFAISATFFSGAIFVDKGEALLINGIESYCRVPHIDCHFEDYQDRSSIPCFTSQYPIMLEICKIYSDNSEKLIIGTKTCNLLVISSIRIDNSETSPEVGPSTKSFNPTRQVKLYLSKASIVSAQNMMHSDPEQILSCDEDPITHIRQLRSRFDHPSTYCLARFYSVFTQDSHVQPYTVYTMMNSDKTDTDAILGSRFMELIYDAIYEQHDSMLLKKNVEDLLPKDPKKITQNRTHIMHILDLYEPEKSSIPVIGNAKLTMHIKFIAEVTTNSLKKANEDIVSNIWKKFRSYKDKK